MNKTELKHFEIHYATPAIYKGEETIIFFIDKEKGIVTIYDPETNMDKDVPAEEVSLPLKDYLDMSVVFDRHVDVVRKRPLCRNAILRILLDREGRPLTMNDPDEPVVEYYDPVIKNDLPMLAYVRSLWTDADGAIHASIYGCGLEEADVEEFEYCPGQTYGFRFINPFDALHDVHTALCIEEDDEN